MAKRPEPSLAARLESIRVLRVGRAASSVSRSEDEPPSAPSTDGGADMDRRTAIVGVQQARRARVPAPRELSIAHEVDTQARLIRSVQKGLVASGVAWERVLTDCGVSDFLVSSARIRSFRRGVLTIQVRDASARYELSRFLRSGGEARVARAARVALHTIKLVP